MRVARGGGGDAFERRPNRVDFEQFVGSDAAHPGTAKRRIDDEPEQRQVAQRLADRRLAHAELLRQPRLDDPGVRGDPSC